MAKRKPKILLQLTIYEDINIPHKLDVLDQTFNSIQYNDIVEAIRQVIQLRLDTNFKTTMEQMRKKGAIKTV